jgi:hypothetical protein
VGDNKQELNWFKPTFLSNISKYKSKIIKDLKVENKPTHITLQDFTTHNGAFMLPKLKFSGFAPLVF